MSYSDYSDDSAFDDFSYCEPVSTPPRKKRRRKPGCLGFLLVIALVIGGAFLLTDLFPGRSYSDPEPTDAVLSTELPHMPEPSLFPTEAATETTEEAFPAEPAVPEGLICTETPPYYYAKLNALQQAAYHQILNGIATHQDEISPVYMPDYHDLFPVVDAVRYDHPELFWFAGKYELEYVSALELDQLIVKPEYRWDSAASEQYRQYVQTVTSPVVDSLQGLSDYEKQLGVYHYLIDYLAYDYDYTAASLYDVFHDGRAVCEGYTYATKYLLDQLGVESIIVIGESVSPNGRDAHAWNIVKLDGAYYQMDTTWGDPYEPGAPQTKSFAYLNLTDEEISQNHFYDPDFYPPCTETYYNYFLHENLYLDTIDRDRIVFWIRSAKENGVPSFHFRVANADLGQQIVDMMYDGSFYRLMEQATGAMDPFSYSYNDVMHIFTIHLK